MHYKCRVRPTAVAEGLVVNHVLGTATPENPAGRGGGRRRADLSAGLGAAAPPQRPAAPARPAGRAAHPRRAVLLPAGRAAPALAALQRGAAARARRPQRLHFASGRRQEAGAQPAARRQLPRHQAGQGLLQGQVKWFNEFK